MALLVKNSVSLPFSKLQFLYCKMGIITPVYKIKRVNCFVGYKGLVLLLKGLLLLADTAEPVQFDFIIRNHDHCSLF